MSFFPSIASSALIFSVFAAYAQTDLPPRRVVFTLSACIAPEMPKAAVDAGVGGEVRAQFTVDDFGAVTDPRIIQSAGDTPSHKAIDAAVVQSIRSCVFPPSPGFSAARVTQVFKFAVTDPMRESDSLGFRPVKRGTETCDALQRPTGNEHPIVTGMTQVQFSVDVEGLVHNAHVTHASGLTSQHRLLDAEAVRHISSCKFPSAQGKAAPVRWTYDWGAL